MPGFAIIAGMVISLDEVKKLAELSRLALSDGEMEAMREDIDSIISYIDTIQKVELPEVPERPVYFDEVNVMREDGIPHEPELYTEALLGQAPRTEGRFLKVKKILG